MSEKETIKITIMGKERDLTLEDLIEIYRQIDDLSPERNARASFVMHKKVQDRKREISKAMETPESMYEFVYGEFKFSNWLNNFGSYSPSNDVPDDVFEVASNLSEEQLKKLLDRVSDPNHIQRLQELLDKKKESEKDKKSPDKSDDSELDR